MIEHLGILKAKLDGGETNTFCESTINLTEIDVELIGRARLLTMLAHRVEINRERAGSATFAKVDAYSPVIPASTPVALEFDVEVRGSRDVKIYRHPNGKAFKCGLAGTYNISTFWYVEIPSPEAMTYVELQLYKNGVFDCVLGGEPIAAYATLGSNAYHKMAYLQGSKLVDLVPTDRIEIRLKHDKAVGFGMAESHGGYVDISLINQN